jgi:hypothetical protein
MISSSAHAGSKWATERGIFFFYDILLLLKLCPGNDRNHYLRLYLFFLGTVVGSSS